MSKPIIIGSRGSDLALWQANYSKDLLENLGHQVEIKIIKTQGDKIQHLSFDKMEGKGFFTKELEDSLLAGEIDLAVHSHKDLPTTNPEGLVIGAVSYREDCTESILIHPHAYDESSIFGIKPGSIVGTSSHRRKSQLLHHQPDLQIKDLRGNVPTRIQKLKDGQYDAILLASAGLNRLGLEPEGLIRKVMPETVFIPAPAQGVLAYQIRESDNYLQEVLLSLHNEDVANTISIERKVLNQLDGGCQLPLGVFSKRDDSGYSSWVSLQPLDGSPYRRFYNHAHSPSVAISQILERIHSKESRRVFISREAEDAKIFVKQASAYGFEIQAQAPVIAETIEVNHLPFTDWVFFTSPKCVHHFFEQDLLIPEVCRVAALGSGTADALKKCGIQVSFVGADGDVRQTAERFLAQVKGKSVLFPTALAGLRTVQHVLGDAVEVHNVIVYETIANPRFEGVNADIAVFTSPMNVEIASGKTDLSNITCVAIGNTTAEALRNEGCKHIVISPFTNEQALADVVCGLS
jgi:hydroxymethylbilane synthase